MENLDPLPVPDYGDYFQQLQRSVLCQYVRPSLLIESARGCWWGEKSHCTFCGLNGLTMAFRTKSVKRTLEEITALLTRYGVHAVRFVDNILSPHYFKDLLPGIVQRGLKANYICEVKSNLKKDQIRTMADAGLTVQAGIENLSTHVLDLMGKGSNSLMNIQTLKWCKQYGVSADWNLLYGFPGEMPDDYRQNLEMAKLLTYLHAPSGCGPIRLDRFSPNFNDSERIGLLNIRPLKFYQYLYPFPDQILLGLAYYFDFDYADKIDDGDHLAGLQEAVNHWKGRDDKLYVERFDNELVIHDSRPVATWSATRVARMAALIYEYCDKVRSLPKIIEVMEELGMANAADHVPTILDEFIYRGLMVREGKRYLSLAVMSYNSTFERREDALAEENARKLALRSVVPQLVAIEPVRANVQP